MQIQRDLFALGACWPIRATIAARVEKATLGRQRRRRGSSSGSTLDGGLPPLRHFILAGGIAGRRAAASRAHGLPPRRARDRRARPGRRRSARRRLHEPPVGSALRHGARGQRAAPASPRSSGSGRGVRALPAAGAAALREFSGRVAAAAARGSPAHRRRLRVCPNRRRLRGRGRTRPTDAAGAARRLAAISLHRPRRGTRPADGSDARSDLHRPGRHDPRCGWRCSCSTICSARSGRTCRPRATRRGTSCSTTAADRPIRSAGWCCASRLPRPSARRWSDAVCTALQLTNFWQDLEIDWRKGRLYVPLDRSCSAPAPTSRTSAAAASPRHGSARFRRHRTDARTVRVRPADRRRRPRPPALGACARRGSAAIRILDRLEAGRFDVFHPVRRSAGGRATY